MRNKCPVQVVDDEGNGKRGFDLAIGDRPVTRALDELSMENWFSCQSREEFIAEERKNLFIVKSRMFSQRREFEGEGRL